MIAGLLALVLVAVVAVAVVAVAWPLARRYSGAAPPRQFYETVRLDPALAGEYPRVVGVAHNAGNNIGTLEAALRHRADVIEIDVISARGRLVAGRDQPWGWLARKVFRGPTLAEAFARASVTGTVKLDLKQTDLSFLNDLVAFVAPRTGSTEVMISSRDPSALRYLHDRLPGVTMLFSVASPEAVGRLMSDRALQDIVGGASVFQDLVTAGLTEWAHQHGLPILAWTVNDGRRLNQLVRLGVDGITTANLAILRALG